MRDAELAGDEPRAIAEPRQLELRERDHLGEVHERRARIGMGVEIRDRVRPGTAAEIDEGRPRQHRRELGGRTRADLQEMAVIAQLDLAALDGIVRAHRAGSRSAIAPPARAGTTGRGGGAPAANSSPSRAIAPSATSRSRSARNLRFPSPTASSSSVRDRSRTASNTPSS